MQFRLVQATLHSWLGIVVLWSGFLIFLPAPLPTLELKLTSGLNLKFFIFKKPPPSFESAQVAYDYLNMHAPKQKDGG